MIVSYETRELPKYSATDSYREIIERVVDGSLAGFTIDKAASSMDSALDLVGADLTDLGFHPFSSNPVPLAVARRASTREKDVIKDDRGLHLDYIRSSRDPKTHLHLHLTERGRGMVTLLEPTDEYWETHTLFSQENDRLFRAGQVDDAKFNPVAHVARLKRKTFLVFRAGGQFPLAHDFKTTRAPRKSKVLHFVD
jgi:hypothetical protein